MPDRIHKYFNDMNKLRDETDVNVDKMLKSINIKTVLSDPGKSMKLIVLKFIHDNYKLFENARTKGQRMGETFNESASKKKF